VWLAVYASGVHATVAGILVALTVPLNPRIDRDEFLKRSSSCLEELEEAELSLQGMASNADQLDAARDLELAAREIQPPAIRLEHYFLPISSYFVLPLFALMNAGVPITDGLIRGLASPVALGVFFGLVVGKQLGVIAASKAAIRFGLAEPLEGVDGRMKYGLAWLTGIGFTMSLFVAGLAFDDPALLDQARAAIIAASVVCGVVGYLILRTKRA
jgi:NhaA family Na+:H+ antiporter